MAVFIPFVVLGCNKMHLCLSSTFKFSDFLSFWSKSVPLRVLSLFCEKDVENLFLKLSQVK